MTKIWANKNTFPQVYFHSGSSPMGSKPLFFLSLRVPFCQVPNKPPGAVSLPRQCIPSYQTKCTREHCQPAAGLNVLNKLFAKNVCLTFNYHLYVLSNRTHKRTLIFFTITGRETQPKQLHHSQTLSLFSHPPAQTLWSGLKTDKKKNN